MGDGVSGCMLRRGSNGNGVRLTEAAGPSCDVVGCTKEESEEVQFKDILVFSIN